MLGQREQKRWGWQGRALCVTYTLLLRAERGLSCAVFSSLEVSEPLMSSMGWRPLAGSVTPVLC